MTVAAQAEDSALHDLGAVLIDRCLACHGPDKQEGGYSVATIAKMKVAGDSAKLPVVPGRPERSELLRRLTTADESERMPAESEPLTAAEIELFRRWIAGGAKAAPTIESEPLTNWITVAKSYAAPKHYPQALPIVALSLTPNYRSIVTSGYGEVVEWDLSSGAVRKRIEVAGQQVADIDISESGRYLAVSSGIPGTRGIVEVWQLDDQRPPRRLWSRALSDISNDIAFDPSGSRLAIAGGDGSLHLVEMSDTDAGLVFKSQIFAPHADAVLALAWSDAGDRLITGSRDRTAKIFDAGAMELIANYDRHERAVGGVAYLGERPVSFDETGRLRLWPGDDSDRALDDLSDLPRFLVHIAVAGDRLLLPDAAELRILRFKQTTIDDGEDDKGNPKTTKSIRWQEPEHLKSGGRDWILSVDAVGDVIAAGTESGEIIIWRDGQPVPANRFLAKP